MSTPFWKQKTLEQMTRDEWESLCDGCAKCCLLKLEDEDTGEIAYTRLQNVAEIKWMPRTCAYRLVLEGKDLPEWHHLVCGDRNRVHTTGNSVRGRTVSEDTVFDEDPEDWIVDWEGNEP
jgi:uncharacterized cysteine cluster protein YcgN (CxxCxxCC family)